MSQITVSLRCVRCVYSLRTDLVMPMVQRGDGWWHNWRQATTSPSSSLNWRKTTQVVTSLARWHIALPSWKYSHLLGRTSP